MAVITWPAMRRSRAARSGGTSGANTGPKETHSRPPTFATPTGSAGSPAHVVASVIMTLNESARQTMMINASNR